MRVIIDGDATAKTVERLARRRELNHRLREAAKRVTSLLDEAENICLEHEGEDQTMAFLECRMAIHEARGVLGMS